MYYTYVLQSLLDGAFYSGFTKDLKQRFGQHHKGQVASTSQRRPLRLVYNEVYPVKSETDELAMENKESYIHISIKFKQIKYLSGACIDRNDALQREKYFKTYYGKMFLKKRLKSYLTG